MLIKIKNFLLTISEMKWNIFIIFSQTYEFWKSIEIIDNKKNKQKFNDWQKFWAFVTKDSYLKLLDLKSWTFEAFNESFSASEDFPVFSVSVLLLTSVSEEDFFLTLKWIKNLLKIWIPMNKIKITYKKVIPQK